MKAKVIIENGVTNIELKPENDFEIDIIEKIKSKKENFQTSVSFCANYDYGSYSKHYIDIQIIEHKK